MHEGGYHIMACLALCATGIETLDSIEVSYHQLGSFCPVNASAMRPSNYHARGISTSQPIKVMVSPSGSAVDPVALWGLLHEPAGTGQPHMKHYHRRHHRRQGPHHSVRRKLATLMRRDAPGKAVAGLHGLSDSYCNVRRVVGENKICLRFAYAVKLISGTKLPKMLANRALRGRLPRFSTSFQKVSRAV